MNVSLIIIELIKKMNREAVDKAGHAIIVYEPLPESQTMEIVEIMLKHMGIDDHAQPVTPDVNLFL